MPPAKRRTSAVATPSSTTGAASRFSRRPCRRSEAKKPGPTCEADRVDEEHQAQLAHELARAVLDVDAEVAEGDPAKRTPAIPRPMPRSLRLPSASPSPATSDRTRTAPAAVSP